MKLKALRLFPAALLTAALLTAALLLHAADKPKTAPPAAIDPYAEVQPATESLDLGMYQRIRDEGLNRSHVMEFATALMDGIGPRLTGSPNLKKANEWTRDTLTKIGLENAHLEDWGEFGLGWQQLNTWARMTTPDTAVLIVQATPWSPSTAGAVTGEVVFVDIKDGKDLEQYKGKLAGKIVLFGAMREVPPVDKALFERPSEKQLADIAEFPVSGNASGVSPEMQARMRERLERQKLIDKVAQFFADEGRDERRRIGRHVVRRQRCDAGADALCRREAGEGSGGGGGHRELWAAVPADPGACSGERGNRCGNQGHRRARARV